MRQRRQLEIIAGRVAGDGSIVAGDGFVVNRVGAGQYAINFPASFRLISLVASNATAWAAGEQILVYSYGGYGVSSVQVSTFNSGGGGVDKAFSFIAAGIQQ